MATPHGARTANLGLLPIEIASQVLASGILSMRDIVRSSRACRAWHSLCSNESILQRAAYVWGYVDDLAVPLAEHVASIKDDEQGYFKNYSSSWKQYCTACHCLEEQVTGNHYSAPVGLCSEFGQEVGYPKVSHDFAAAQSKKPEDEVYQDVWRIVIDSEERTLISTGANGGVWVTDLETKDLLWSIPASQTRAYPHLEGGEGYIMWDLNRRALSPGSTERISVYKSERLCDDIVEPRRGHYRHYWTVEHDIWISIWTFRFKYPILAMLDQDYSITFWDVVAKERLSRLSCKCEQPLVLTPFRLDFDDEFVFVLGNGYDQVCAWERATGRHVWQISADHVPVLMRDPYEICTDPPEEVAIEQCGKRHKSVLRAGIAFRPPFAIDTKNMRECNHPDGDRREDSEIWYKPRSYNAHIPWRSILVCQETNTLVFCSLLQIVILRDYKHFFKNQASEPELFVSFQMSDMLPRSEANGCFSNADLYHLNASLSVCAGRALWAGWGHFLVDFKEAQSAHEVKITQLVERGCEGWWGECHPAGLLRPTESLDGSEEMAFDPVDQMLVRQLDQTQYTTQRGRCSSAILTRTAGFVIEHQVIKDTELNSLPAPAELKGRSGAEPWSDYYINCIRSWDFGRSALYEFDRDSCQKQVSRFKDFPITEKKLRQLSEHAVMRYIKAGMSLHDLDIDLDAWSPIQKDLEKEYGSDAWDSDRSGDEWYDPPSDSHLIQKPK